MDDLDDAKDAIGSALSKFGARIPGCRVICFELPGPGGGVYSDEVLDELVETLEGCAVCTREPGGLVGVVTDAMRGHGCVRCLAEVRRDFALMRRLYGVEIHGQVTRDAAGVVTALSADLSVWLSFHT